MQTQNVSYDSNDNGTVVSPIFAANDAACTVLLRGVSEDRMPNRMKKFIKLLNCAQELIDAQYFGSFAFDEHLAIKNNRIVRRNGSFNTLSVVIDHILEPKNIYGFPGIGHPMDCDLNDEFDFDSAVLDKKRFIEELRDMGVGDRSRLRRLIPQAYRAGVFTKDIEVSPKVGFWIPRIYGMTIEQYIDECKLRGKRNFMRTLH